MHNEKPLKQSHLRLETDLRAVEEVLQWFEQFAPPLLPEQVWQQSQIALVEGFTNAVRHAHQSLPQTTLIEIELKLFSDCLEIRIWDQGQPFDLYGKLEALCHEDCDPLEKEGGRGLMFIQQLTDELSYQRLDDQRNCLFMRKWL